jgi:hypothetical protein
MSTQLQTVTLQTAVLMQVKEFANNNKAFSVHDITREVRQKVNQGVLEIPEVEVAGASFRFDIPHAKVKALFDELWRTGVFDPDFALNRNFNGVYFEYTPSPVNSPSPAASFSVSQPPVASPVASPSASPTFLIGKVEVTNRIEKYLDNCETRQFQPTLKQVQSAIKRGNASTGWSCEDIREIVTSDLGYSVVDDPDYVSAAQVVV